MFAWESRPAVLHARDKSEVHRWNRQRSFQRSFLPALPFVRPRVAQSLGSLLLLPPIERNLEGKLSVHQNWVLFISSHHFLQVDGRDQIIIARFCNDVPPDLSLSYSARISFKILSYQNEPEINHTREMHQVRTKQLTEHLFASHLISL